MEDRVYNFAAGPSMLADEVLETAQREILNYHGSGMSVMEMSHRSSMFQEIFDATKEKCKKILNIPDNYEVLFLQGGGSTQFSMIPLNMIGKTGKADYIVTGNFSGIAKKEAQKYGEIHVSYDGVSNNYSHIPTQDELTFDANSAYVHYCDNNTIFGTEWNYVPDTNGIPLVCDMSSNIFSKNIDVTKYDLIYAGAQKNLAPAGVTIVICKKDLGKDARKDTPLMMDYTTLIQKDSMYNTPPCWCIYMLGLTLDWIEKQGGLAEMERRKEIRSKYLYDVLDQSRLYIPHAQKEARSQMNVTFRTGNDALDKKFVEEAAELGLVNLKGHRLTGGIRASIYNAMPIEGAKKLAQFMKEFEVRNG